MSRVVICGAGVVGLCCAHYLRARGHAVTVIERAPEDRDGCSFGNTGLITPSQFIPLAAPGMAERALRGLFNPRSPFRIRPRLSAELLAWSWRFLLASTPEQVARSSPLLRDLTRASRALYEELADATVNDLQLVRRGLLVLCKTTAALEDEVAVARQARELGIPAEVVSPARAAELDPGVRMDIAGAVHFPRDGHLTPRRLMNALHGLTHAARVNFLWSTEVTGWRVAAGRVAAVVTGAGEIAADEFVLAGGVWSAATVRDLKLRLPLQPGKGYSVTLIGPCALPRLCSLLAEARVAVTPMGQELRIGGTLEIDPGDDGIRPERVRSLMEAVPRYFPEFSVGDFQDLPVWRGLRPCTPDGLPYVGRFGRLPNLIAATGHAMLGISLAPITGSLVAELVSGVKPSHSMELLSPDRFG